MTKYEVLLQRPEWKAKRKEILKRDGSSCTICANKNLFEKADLGILCRIGVVMKDDVAKGNIGHVRLVKTKKWVEFYHPNLNPREKYRHSIVLVTSTSIEFKRSNYHLLALDLPRKEYLQLMYLLITEEKDSIKYQAAMDSFCKLSAGPWSYVSESGLHVHHKYYQQRLAPWEYPDDALTTLCWVCHAETHQNSTVPHYDANRLEIGKMTCCSRCNGAGSFPAYSHIQSGICFRCNGAKYEELIQMS